ncbi:MAG: alpha/beta hydrolase [Desulfobacteraceae bacterium]|jgi:pimeloyl-ACP methyl ester carboxylesterase|nr:alpha/beta hydrolase [Desulfobacteraceae bacterium]
MTNIKNVSDLRGTGSLMISAIIGATKIIEDLHHTILNLAGKLSVLHLTKGITEPIYRNIHAVCKYFDGGGIDTVLNKVVPLFVKKVSVRETVLSILNGVLGDYLAASNNPLTISMQLRRNGEPLSMDDKLFSNLESGSKLALMIHGACMNDLHWNKRGHDHGADLARDMGYIPIYLYYNTGLHISENGKLLSNLMETFINKLPQPIEIVIIAHSMGGFVSRSACHYGKLDGHTWLNYLRKLVFLGTPHHGSPLERWGNRIDLLLEKSPYSIPFSRLGKIRSAGVTDLRYGNLLDNDWKGRDRFKKSGDIRVSVPLPDGVQCYTMAVTIVRKSNNIGDNFIGDGLVTLNSALGCHENTDLKLLFPENHQWIGRNMNHMDFLNQSEVYETIKRWLKE